MLPGFKYIKDLTLDEIKSNQSLYCDQSNCKYHTSEWECSCEWKYDTDTNDCEEFESYEDREE